MAPKCSSLYLKTLEAYVALSKPPGPWDLIVPASVNDVSELRSCSELSETSQCGHMCLCRLSPQKHSLRERSASKFFLSQDDGKLLSRSPGNMNIGELGDWPSTKANSKATQRTMSLGDLCTPAVEPVVHSFGSTGSGMFTLTNPLFSPIPYWLARHCLGMLRTGQQSCSFGVLLPL